MDPTTLPRDAAGCQQLIREAWRQSAALEPGSSEAAAAVDNAFKCLKVMGEFQAELDALIERRTSNAVRTGVVYAIGDVLRHRKYGYRAVVAGWDRRPQVDVSEWDGIQSLPSGSQQPFYRMLPDMADCHELLGGPRDMKYVAQENLELLPPSHRRVHHPGLMGSLFSHFDAEVGAFIPTVDLAFEYPGSRRPSATRDAEAGCSAHASTILASLATLSSRMAQFVDGVAKHQHVKHVRRGAADADVGADRGAEGGKKGDAGAEGTGAADAPSAAEEPNADTIIGRFPGGEIRDGRGRYNLMASLQEMASRAKRVSAAGLALASAEPNAEPNSERRGGAAEGEAAAVGEGEEDGGDEGEYVGEGDGPVRACFSSMRQVGEVFEFVNANLAEREAKSDRREILYHVGQVLRHRKFGFRAAICGWERRPQVDVSEWDGVRDLPSGGEQPFYRCVPDLNDCIDLLGGPRGVRYVAQENLEPLPRLSDCGISHELLPQLFDGYDERSGTFVPVQQLRYWYPEDALPEAVAEASASPELGRAVHAIELLESLLNVAVLEARQSGLVEPVLGLLTAAGSADDAATAERAAAMLMAVHPNKALMSATRQSQQAIERNDLDRALEALDEALALDEAHAESWARRASVHARVGRYERSLEDADQALRLESRHFGALAARGSALRGLRRYEEALEAFEAALKLHPWAAGVATSIYKTERAVQLRGKGGEYGKRQGR